MARTDLPCLSIDRLESLGSFSSLSIDLSIFNLSVDLSELTVPRVDVQYLPVLH